MDQEFWQQRWRSNEIGFHQEQINPYLQAFWDGDGVAKKSAVFVPLCGKSSDMIWLRDQGYQVKGVEISPLAVRAFFADKQLTHRVLHQGKFELYEAERLTIFCGDFFDLTSREVGDCAAIYDRAALVALPPPMRARYAQHLQTIVRQDNRILLVTMEYPQSEMDGPPFCVSDEEVYKHYGERYEIERVNSYDVLQNNARFRERGLSRLVENTFLMRKK